MSVQKAILQSGYLWHYEIVQENLYTRQGMEGLLEGLEKIFDDLEKNLTSPEFEPFNIELAIFDMVGSINYRLGKKRKEFGLRWLHNRVAGKIEGYNELYNDRRYMAHTIDRHEPFGKEINPWNRENMLSYLALSMEEELKPRIRRLLGRLAGMHRLVAEGKSHVYDLLEDDQTWFGEPMLVAMAIADQEFIPCYTNCLRHWDLEHEVYQNDAIFRIVLQHGFISPVEDLLVARVGENIGQNAYEIFHILYPVMKEHYGDFAKTELFSRIIEAAHKRKVEWYNELLSDGRGKDDMNVKRCVEDLELIWIYDDDELLGEVKRRCAILDRQAGLIA